MRSGGILPVVAGSGGSGPTLTICNQVRGSRPQKIIGFKIIVISYIFLMLINFHVCRDGSMEECTLLACVHSRVRFPKS